MCRCQFDTDPTKHDVDWLARAQAHKANPSLSSPLSSLQSRRILCDCAVALAGLNLLAVHEQTNLALHQDKIHQT